METNTLNIICYIFAGLMFIGLSAIIIERIINKKSPGARSIQLLTVVFIIPLIGILSLSNHLENQTTATLIGALTGYLLSGLGNFKSGD